MPEGEVYELWWSDGRRYVPDPPLPPPTIERTVIPWNPEPWTPDPPIGVPRAPIPPPELVLRPVERPEEFRPEPEPRTRPPRRCRQCGELAYASKPPLCAECHERVWQRQENIRAGGMRLLACDRFFNDPRQLSYQLSWGSGWLGREE